MTNAPTYGDLYQFFLFTNTGRKWLRRNQLMTQVRIAIRAAIELSKEEASWFLARYWAFDTGATSQEGIDYIRKRAFTDFDTPYGLYIGANLDYFQYVLTMAERMQARGKQVNWTNAQTKTIENDILGNTLRYVNDRLKINIKDALSGIGLGWMLGQGRMPQRIDVLGKQIKRFQGAHKPIEWLQ